MAWTTVAYVMLICHHTT